MAGNGSGHLEVGTNEMHEVVINLPRDMTGHIVFSPHQARELADTLNRKASTADQARRAAVEAERIASVPPVDRTNVCTLSGEPASKVRAEQTEQTGQHKSYIVLCEEERQKGFVRPYRDRYQHVGRLEQIITDGRERADQPHAHEHRVGGCGGVTTMGRALSETYARDPAFYGATFCVICNAHFPVDQFVWTADGEQVGS